MIRSVDSQRPALRALEGGREGGAPLDERGVRDSEGAGVRVAGRGSGTLGAARAGRAGAAPPLDECVVSRGAVRVGDRHEPWTLAATDALRRLAASAYAVGIDFELATRLAVECELTCRDLRAAGIDPAQLDAAAATERVEQQLDASACAYLRRLTQLRDDAPRRDLGDAVTVGLPSRLSARLVRTDVGELLADADIARAIRWETAAVLAGRTISEWAPLTALQARAPSPAPPDAIA